MRRPGGFLLLSLLATAAASSVRLDAALVANGQFASRAAAKAAIKAGRVTLDGEVIKKASFAVSAAAAAALLVAEGEEEKYVSRAGLKLQAALDAFSVDLAGAAVLDIGASTGGFTDCALQAGASQVVCVDNGHDQLAAKLATDPRVTSLEGLNARSLTADMLPRNSFDLIVII